MPYNKMLHVSVYQNHHQAPFFFLQKFKGKGAPITGDEGPEGE